MMIPRRVLACWLFAIGLWAQDTAQVTSGGATIEVAFGPGKFDFDESELTYLGLQCRERGF